MTTPNPAPGISADSEIQISPPVTLSGIKEDLLMHARERNGRPAWRYTIDILLALMLSSGFHMMLLWRFGAAFHKCKLIPLSILVEKMIYHLYHCSIPCSAKIAQGLWVPHPLGIVFSNKTRIGRNVWIRQHVQIVDVWEGYKSGIVGDYARLNTSVIMIRGAVIGHSSIIGAAALVNKAIPPEHLGVGQPATTKPLRPEQIPSRKSRYK